MPQVLAVLCGFKTDTEEVLNDPVAIVRVGNLCNIPFRKLNYAYEFLEGYRSGMARVWKSSYIIPGKPATYRDRGMRFAWLAHICGRKHKDDYPEARIIYAEDRQLSCEKHDE